MFRTFYKIRTLYREEKPVDAMSAWVVIGLVVLGWQLFAAVFWPFVSCPMPGCSGGKRVRPGKRKKRSWRNCGWCGGSGKRLRWPRRVYDHLTRGRRR